MTIYKVVWEIYVDAEDLIDAAKQAEKIKLDPASTDRVFKITSDKIENYIVNLQK